MRVLNSNQIPFQSIQNNKIDYLLCASGYEQRSTFVSSRLDLKRIKNKINFAFKNELQSIS